MQKKSQVYLMQRKDTEVFDFFYFSSFSWKQTYYRRKKNN